MSLCNREVMEINTALGETLQKRKAQKYFLIGAGVHFMSLLYSLSPRFVHIPLFALHCFFKFVCELTLLHARVCLEGFCLCVCVLLFSYAGKKREKRRDKASKDVEAAVIQLGGSVFYLW